MNSMIKDDLIELKNTRMFLHESAEILKKAREEFNAQNSTIICQINKAKVEEQLLIDSIKEEALNIYKINGHESHICQSVKIIKTNIITYGKKDAENWAEKHNSGFINYSYIDDFIKTETAKEARKNKIAEGNKQRDEKEADFGKRIFYYHVARLRMC